MVCDKVELKLKYKLILAPSATVSRSVVLYVHVVPLDEASDVTG